MHTQHRTTVEWRGVEEEGGGGFAHVWGLPKCGWSVNTSIRHERTEMSCSQRADMQAEGRAGLLEADPPSSKPWHKDGAAAGRREAVALQKSSPVSERSWVNLLPDTELYWWEKGHSHTHTYAQTRIKGTSTWTGIKTTHTHVHKACSNTAKSILKLVVSVFAPPAALHFLMVSFVLTTLLFVLTCLIWSESVLLYGLFINWYISIPTQQLDLSSSPSCGSSKNR